MLKVCFGLYRLVLVSFGLTKTPKLTVFIEKQNNRHKRFVSDSAEIVVSFQVRLFFASKLVSKDTLLLIILLSVCVPLTSACSTCQREKV